jgi:hypothetical protein
MTTQKLAHIEHTSQLLIFQVKNAYQLIGKAWYELELARVDLKELIAAHKEWEQENGPHISPQERNGW